MRSASLLSPTILAVACTMAGAAEEQVSAREVGQAVPIYAEAAIVVVGAVDGIGRIDEPRMLVGLDGDQLPRYNDDSIGQAIRRMPGITHTGPPGVVKDVRVRGLPKGFTQIRIDGEGATGGTADRQAQVDLLPPGLVVGVELSHIPTADQDHGAIGGSVDVQLRDIPTDRVVGGNLSGSMHEDRWGGGATAYAGDGRGWLGWLVGAGAQRSWLLKDDEEVTRTASGAAKESKTKPESARTDEADALAKMRWRAAEGLTLGIDAILVTKREDKDKPEEKYNAAGILTEAKGKDQEVKNNILAQVTGRIEIERDEHRVTASGTATFGGEEKERMIETTRKWNASGVYTGQDVKMVAQDDKTDRGWRARLVHDWHAAEDVEWRWGAEVRDDRHKEEKLEDTDTFNAVGVRTRNVLKPQDFTGQETTFIGFAMATVMAGDHTLIPGVRIEAMRRDIEASLVTTTTVYPAATSTVVGGSAGDSGDSAEVLPSLHWRWTLGEHVALRAGGARLLRQAKWADLTPLVTQASGTLVSPDKAGNPDLDPERAWAADAGVQAEFLELRLEGGLTVYQRWIEDVIQSRTALEDGRYVARPQNVGDGWTHGIETDLRLGCDPLLPGLDLWGNWALMRSEVADPELGDIPMSEVPAYAYTIGFDQALGGTGVSCGAAYNVRGPSRKVESAKSEEEDDFALLDAYVAYTWRRNWEVRFSGGNILDEPRRRVAMASNGDVTVHTEDGGPTWTLSIAGEW